MCFGRQAVRNAGCAQTDYTDKLRPHEDPKIRITCQDLPNPAIEFPMSLKQSILREYPKPTIWSGKPKIH